MIVTMIFKRGFLDWEAIVSKYEPGEIGMECRIHALTKKRVRVKAERVAEAWANMK